MSKIFKNTFLYTLGNSIPMGVTLFLLPLYTNYLSTDEYGIVGSMESVKIFFSIIFSICIERGIVRLYFNYDTDLLKKKFLGVVFVLLIIVSFSILLLAFVFRDSIQDSFANISFYPYILYAILIAFFTNLEHLPKLFYRLKEEANKFVFLSLFYFFLSTALIVWYVVFQEEGALGYLKGQLYSSVFMSVIYLFISFRIVILNFDFKIIKELLSFTLPFLPVLLFSWAINLSNRIFLENYSSLESVGIFSFAAKISIASSVFTTALMVSFEPNFYKWALEGKDGKLKIKNFFNLFFLIAVISNFALVFFSKEILILFFNQKYWESSDIIAILALTSLFSTGTGVAGMFFQQSKKMVQNMYISFSFVIVVLILNYSLIPLYGSYGAATALLLSSIYGFLALYYYAKKNCFHVDLPLIKTFYLIIFLTAIFIFSEYFIINSSLFLNIFIKILIFLLLIFLFGMKYKDELLNSIKRFSKS